MNPRILLAALCFLNTGCGLWLDAFAPRPRSDAGIDAGIDGGRDDASVAIDVDIVRDVRIEPDASLDTGRCVHDDECIALSDACNSGRCVSNACVREPDHEGAACEDATGCFTGMCLAGECNAHPRDCTEFDSVCTVGACAPGGGCVAMSRPPTVDCEDSDFCSWDDGCRMGACAGITTDCGVRADVVSRATTIPFGNAGAPRFADTCPEGQVVIGIQAGVATGYWASFLRQYSTLCGVVQATTGATPTLTITPAPPPLGLRGISPGEPAEPRMCPPGHVVVGVEGATQPGPTDPREYLSQVRIRCAPLSAVSDGPGRAHVLVGAPIVTGMTLGMLNTLAVPPVDCPPGTVAMGASGHADEILDALGLQCGTVKLRVITTAPSPGTRVEANLFRDDCPYGHVPVGLRAQLSMIDAGLYDRNLTQLETLCAPITLLGSGPSAWTTTVGAIVPTRPGPRGMRTGTAVMQTCGPNQVVVGYSGDGGAAMTRIILRCARVTAMGDLSALEFGHGAVTALAPLGVLGDRAFGTTECPTGTVGSGFFGTANQVVNDLALRCAAPTFFGR